MGRQWEADIQLTEGQAALLIEQQFPGLAPAQLEPLGSGWDNIAFLVNGRRVFRFPRRQVAASLLEREARVLPLLAPHLPLRIPVPDYVGAPTPGYPYVFAGYPILAGETACRRPLPERERVDLAPALAGFLAALHRIPIEAETLQWAPGDEIGRADAPRRAPRMKERILANPVGLEPGAVRALCELVDELATTPMHTQGVCWVHGDLYARHLVLNGANQLVGVIDWGDVHVGDPAIDLSIAFSFLPSSARRQFRQVYGEIDEATWKQARFRAIHYGALLSEYGAATGDMAIRAAGEYALRFAPAGS